MTRQAHNEMLQLNLLERPLQTLSRMMSGVLFGETINTELRGIISTILQQLGRSNLFSGSGNLSVSQR